MVENRLSSSLSELGYQRVDSNAQGIYLFFRVDELELHIISVIHAPTGNELTVEQYSHIVEQIKEKFGSIYSRRIRLLGLILTYNPDLVKELSTELQQDSHWIIDLRMNRLILYESEANEYKALRDRIEQVLVSEEQEKLEKQTFPNTDLNQNAKGQYNRRDNQRVQFTPVNMIIIGINLILFVIMHYTNIFGGEEMIYGWGALSWYSIRESREYYRILTSMFIHADLSHLLNNMIVLLFIGNSLEQAAGKVKYLFIYFGSGIIAGITSISYNMWKEYTPTYIPRISFSVGASGAIFGVVGAILFIVIINKGRLAEISARQMILFVVLSLYSGIINTQIDQAAHIGGFLAGILLSILLYRRPKKRKEAPDYF